MSRIKFATIADVYKKYPTNTLSKFKRIANKYGFTDDEAKEYLNNKVVHDQHIPPPKFMHIYSKIPEAFQMDTFFDDTKSATGIGNPDYLMFININSRKAYAYPMSGKGAKEVLRSLNNFIKDEPECKSIMSDEDAAYLSNTVLDYMREHDIIYTTTTDNDLNKLGIINRFMRTIRDMKSNEPNTDILDLVESYNDMPHRSLNYKSPNEITRDDELEYINKMESQCNPYKFKPGDTVRVVLDKSPLTKHRTNLSKESYIVDSPYGNQFLIRSSDGSVDTVPGYKLVKSAKNVPLAVSIIDGKRGIVKDIRSYNTKNDTYSITYLLPDNSLVKDTIKSKYMREGHPTKLSTMERQYWLNQNSIPDRIKKFI
ncbi:hypothetical protein M9Y10_017101 [Tritrichomonas musculus]|uniref:Integrase catalytic domain-containing protein n=1 Tax=Tritrichomonas musculus TaxID=1915356 RepID=A0ABR2HV63_9EUKA